MSNFSTESLIRAMHLPVDGVIQNFKNEKEDHWHTESTQAELASIISRIVEPSSSGIRYEPAARYIRKLLQSYARAIEESDLGQIENDELVEIMMEYQYRSRQQQLSLDENVPNPTESCYVSYEISKEAFIPEDSGKTCTGKQNFVGIKIYPHHNDVGVQKVWEAGAALTEFLISNKHYIRNKHVCELGAGVGLTGLVIAGTCQTKRVHMTDYTNATLENLEHNCIINNEWVQFARKNVGVHDENIQAVTAGYLEWDEFQSKDMSNINGVENLNGYNSGLIITGGGGIHGEKSCQFLKSPETSLMSAMNADVLIAADVVYDRNVIPQLIQVVRNTLVTSSPRQNKIAIFATTYRNADTFALFQNELQRCSDEIDCNFIDSEELKSMPHIFPCYFRQPRSHVRICIISLQR